jgi:peroxiredoxin
MRTPLSSSVALFAAAMATGAIAQNPGQAAPAFSVTDVAGKPVALADYKGKYVVLEWTNPECPFVRAQYKAEAMQAVQKEAGAKDVVWLTINSTNQSHSEYKTGAQMASWMTEQGAAPKAILIDPTSAAARAYAAKTTPHMFVIDPAGKVIYNGAIDDKRSASVSDRKTANNYVRAALNDATAGRPVVVASTQPYGCSLKY